jgi:hypothetical protein
VREEEDPSADARALSLWTLEPQLLDMLNRSPSRLWVFANSWIAESNAEHGIGTDMSKRMCCLCPHQLRPSRPPGWQLVERLANIHVKMGLAKCCLTSTWGKEGCGAHGKKKIEAQDLRAHSGEKLVPAGAQSAALESLDSDFKWFLQQVGSVLTTER